MELWSADRGGVFVPIKGTFPLTRSGYRSAERILGLQCFHVVCFHYGGAEAGRRRVYAAGPQEWVLEPFFVAVWRQLASSLLEYRSRDIDIKEYSDRSESRHANVMLCCLSACQISKRLNNSINIPASTFHGILGQDILTAYWIEHQLAESWC